MRIIPEYISQSVTVSTRTEAMLIKLQDKCYFIEYKTNLPPIPENLKRKGDLVSEVTEEEFQILKECFEQYTDDRRFQNWLHAPSYINAYCKAKDLTFTLLN